jgi:hypothetical protein
MADKGSSPSRDDVKGSIMTEDPELMLAPPRCLTRGSDFYNKEHNKKLLH